MLFHDFAKKYNRKNSGFVTLVSVLAIGAIGVAIAVSVILLGVSSSRTSLAFQQSNQAMALANTCAEEALQEIRDSILFTGNGNLSIGEGTCSYTVTSQGGESRTITSRGDVGTIVRKVEIVINSITPTIGIASWQEVADF
ncbi:MAG TPA: hypothetical protein VFQ59_01610 [Candidatus Paceibacterota bacterium]|nr:hypothetical protein [Candidatus Paceibacterota bacterium]